MSSLRAVLSPVFIALASIVGSLAAFLARLVDPSGDRVLDLARAWARLILRFGGVELEVRRRGQLEPGQPYVFMANHQSSVDIWALLVVLPRVRMIAKKQLARIPLFGWAMRAGRFIFIDRANAVRARRSIEVAKERIRGGHSVLMFPEGTRARDGRLLPFKKGGFHLAMDAGVPIVPIALQGTREVMPRGSAMLRAGRVVVTIGAPIATAGLDEQHRAELLERVRGEIEAMLSGGGAAAESAAATSAAPAARVRPVPPRSP